MNFTTNIAKEYSPHNDAGIHSSIIYILLPILVAIFTVGCSPIALYGLGKQNPSVDVCKNSAFALAIARGDVAAVQNQIHKVKVNEHYIGDATWESMSYVNKHPDRWPQVGFNGCKHQVNYLDIALRAKNLKMVTLLLENGANPNDLFMAETPYTLDHPHRDGIYNPFDSRAKVVHVSAICPKEIEGIEIFPETKSPGSEFNLNAIRLLAKYNGLGTDCRSKSVVEAYVERKLFSEARLLVELGATINPSRHRFYDYRVQNWQNTGPQLLDGEPTSPLHFTLSKIPEGTAFLEYANFLISHGAKVDNDEYLPDTILSIAKHPKGNASHLQEVFKLLARHRGNYLKTKQALIETSLSTRVFCLECFQLLAKTGTDFSDGFEIFFDKKSGNIPANVFATLDVIKSLGGDISRSGQQNITPLYRSLTCSECMIWYINHGASPNDPKMPPLEFLLRTNNKDWIETLIGKGADINAKNSVGVPLLFAAIRNAGNQTVGPNGSGNTNRGEELSIGLGILLKHKVNLSVVDNDNNTALHIAADEGNPSLIRLLMQNGQKITAQNKYGVTPLLMSIEQGDYEIMKVLLESGFDPSAPSNNHIVNFAADCELQRMPAASVEIRGKVLR